MRDYLSLFEGKNLENVEPEVSPPLLREIFLGMGESISSGFFLREGNPARSVPGEEIFLLGRLRLTYEGPSNSRRRDPSWDHGRSSILIDSPRR